MKKGDVNYTCKLEKYLKKFFGKPLNECFDEMVVAPFGLYDTCFLLKDRQRAVNSNVKEELRGIVNDYNCQFLGGVAGNAGLFSNLSDVTKYVKILQGKGYPLFSKAIFEEAVRNHTEGMSESRGLGFLYVDERYVQGGGLFEDGAIGHCGHTGQSIFLDYRTGFYVIILSDATVTVLKKYGVSNYPEVMDMRTKLHAAIKKDIERRLQ